MTQRSPGDDAPRGGTPEALGDVLRRVMRQPVFSTRRRRSKIARIWETAAGEELAAQTRPAALRKGVLIVDVGSSGLLHELQSFRRKELLDRVLEQDDSGRIRSLRFRFGVF